MRCGCYYWGPRCAHETRNVQTQCPSVGLRRCRGFRPPAAIHALAPRLLLPSGPLPKPHSPLHPQPFCSRVSSSTVYLYAYIIFYWLCLWLGACSLTRQRIYQTTRMFRPRGALRPGALYFFNTTREFGSASLHLTRCQTVRAQRQKYFFFRRYSAIRGKGPGQIRYQEPWKIVHILAYRLETRRCRELSPNQIWIKCVSEFALVRRAWNAQAVSEWHPRRPSIRRKLQRLLSITLGLPESWFSPYHRRKGNKVVGQSLTLKVNVAAHRDKRRMLDK